MLVLAVTVLPCDTNIEAALLDELATDDELLEDELLTDELLAGLPLPVKDTAIVWLAEIALKV